MEPVVSGCWPVGDGKIWTVPVGTALVMTLTVVVLLGRSGTGVFRSGLVVGGGVARSGLPRLSCKSWCRCGL